MRVLIVKLSSIGDVIHTLPALAAIRRALPEANISWAVETRAAEILRGNQLLERLIEIDTRALRREKSLLAKLKSARQQFAAIGSERFDVALDFQGLLKSAALAKLSGAPRRVGFAKQALREPASRFLLTETIETPPRVHVIEKNLRLAEVALQIGVSYQPETLEFPIFTEREHQMEAAQVIEQTGESFAILNPGGGWTTKLWDAAKFGALADIMWKRFGLKSAVTFGPGEEDLARAVLASSQAAKSIAINLSLKGFYELAKRATVYVGGDTGPTHLAVAAGAAIVGLFGPTDWWRNGSPRSTDVCVERTDIGCRENCYRRSCHNWICMDLDTERVAQAIETVLERKTQNLERSDFGRSRFSVLRSQF